MSDNPIPNHLEAEAAVLGAILVDPQCIYSVTQKIKPEDFYDGRHQIIFEALAGLHNDQMPIEFLALTTRLDKAGKLEKVGGAAYISALINHMPSAFNVMAYAKEVEDSSIRRKLLKAAGELSRLAFDVNKPIDDVVQLAESAVFNVRNQIVASDTVSMNDAANSLWDTLNKMANGTMKAISTGFSVLDPLFQLRESELTIVAARPKLGKSSLVLNIAQNIAKHGHRTLMFALEMSARQLAGRIAASRGNITTQQLQSGQIPDDLWHTVSIDIQKASELPIWINDKPGQTHQSIRSECLKFTHEHFKPDLVVVDYLQLMKRPGKRRDDLEVGDISRAMKLLARELGIPIILVSQLNRSADGVRPKLCHLRESGALEQDADNIIFIHRAMRNDSLDPELSKNVSAEIIIAAQRSGPSDEIRELAWIGRKVSFFNKAPTSNGYIPGSAF